jgi:hypothetical protein
MMRNTGIDLNRSARRGIIRNPSVFRRLAATRRVPFATLAPSKAGLSAGLVFVWLCFAVVPASAGPIYDAWADFDTVNNPSQINGGAFSYGKTASLGSTFTLLGDHLSSGPFVGYVFAAGASLPEVIKYTGASTSTTVLPGGTITIQPGQLELHPGTSGQYAVVRFTAPAAGSYAYTAVFNGADSHPTSVDVHVLINSSLDNAAFINLNGGGNTASLSSPSVALALGGTIDFAVGMGNGDFHFDSTGLFATVTAVPEPSTVALFGTGTMALTVVGRRRWRTRSGRLNSPIL